MSSGMPEREFLPYGRQSVDDDDIQAVVNILRSDWLTTGPTIGCFEHAVASFVGGGQAVAVSSGTAALHAAMYSIDIGPGDEVIVPSMTFVGTANAVVYQRGTPVFVDVREADLLIDPVLIEEKISSRTKAIIAVDYAGQPCDYATLREITDKYGLFLIADACHSLGATYKGNRSGSLADLTIFSFHPVKPITSGEGGMVVTNNPDWIEKIRQFRNHGITTSHQQRSRQATWCYEMTDLGYNYRLTDIQAALGLSQLKKLSKRIFQRQEIAAHYDRLLQAVSEVKPLTTGLDISHGYHLYVIKVSSRGQVFKALRNDGIGCNVHYYPVHLQPYYRRKFGTRAGECPVAENAYEQILSLPIFPGMVDTDIEKVVFALSQCV